MIALDHLCRRYRKLPSEVIGIRGGVEAMHLALVFDMEVCVVGMEAEYQAKLEAQTGQKTKVGSGIKQAKKFKEALALRPKDDYVRSYYEQVFGELANG